MLIYVYLGTFQNFHKFTAGNSVFCAADGRDLAGKRRKDKSPA
jgi:hypothetical protein